jgi:hypothetical protein
MDEKPKPCPPAAAALLDDPESAKVLKSITPAEVIEVPWTLACFTATSCVTPVDDPLDVLCHVEQALLQ